MNYFPCAESRSLIQQRGCCPQPRRDSLCPPWISSFNTGHTEHLSELCVEALLTTEDTEALRTRVEIFAARQEADCWCYGAGTGEQPKCVKICFRAAIRSK